MNYRIGYQIALMAFMLGLSTMVLADEQVHTAVMDAQTQEAKTPQQVLQRLIEGNQRFAEGRLKNRDLLFQASASAASQHPVAVLLNCMDARTPPEIVLDQGIGDVFVTRIAGNVQNDDILGSLEFGTQLAGAKLIVVIGHTNCGAIRGACQQAKLGRLTGLLQKVQPAVEQAMKETNISDCDNIGLINQIAKDNVQLVMKQIQANSPVLDKLIQQGKLGIVGGMQDLTTGKVTFFTDNIMKKEG